MPLSRINGVNLYWEQASDAGAPLVLVHGSWGDHANWAPVVPALARFCRVVTYDRRGHSQSERPVAQGSIDEDVADLAELLTALGLAPAHVAGNSFGAAITLRLAVARPELLASIVIHEPPLLGMLEGDPLLSPVLERIAEVVDTLRAGDNERGARLFVEQVALGPGSWQRLRPNAQRTFVDNAPTFLDEAGEPDSLKAPYLDELPQFSRPVLLTQGDKSPAHFPVIVEKIAPALPRAVRHTFRGAGHVPHISHPEDYVSVVGGFLRGAGVLS